MTGLKEEADPLYPYKDTESSSAFFFLSLSVLTKVVQSAAEQSTVLQALRPQH